MAALVREAKKPPGRAISRLTRWGKRLAEEGSLLFVLGFVRSGEPPGGYQNQGARAGVGGRMGRGRRRPKTPPQFKGRGRVKVQDLI